MAKRTNSRKETPASEANDNSDATRPRTSRSRGERGAALPNVAPRAAEELPNIPDVGDLADQAAQSETMGVVPTASERQSISNTRETSHDTQSASMGSEPSDEDIRLRAYHRYLERGAVHGAHFDDWLEAERELKQSGRKGDL